MGALVDRLRAAQRKMIAEGRSVSDPVASPRKYAAIRERFYKDAGRCNGVPKSLDQKKRREASILLAFLLEYERLPTRRIYIGDAPDFRFSVGRRRVGMELVEAFVSPIRVNQEKLQDKIVARAMQLHEQRGGKPMRVHVSFADTDFRQSQVESAAAVLAKVVPSTVSRKRSLRRSQGWPGWLRDVHVSRRPRFLRNVARWDAAHGGSVHAEGCLRQVIQQKEKKLPAYRKAQCDEYWLLIYVAGTSASSFIDLNDRDSIFESAFHKIFLFSPTEDEDKRVIRPNVHCDRKRQTLTR
jgi:hypothetical protein